MDATMPCTCVPCLQHDSIDEQAYRNANLKAAVEAKRLARKQANGEPAVDFGPEPDWSLPESSLEKLIRAEEGE